MDDTKRCFAIKVGSAHVGKAAHGYKPEHWIFVWADELVEAMDKARWFRGWKRNAVIPKAFALNKVQEAELLSIAIMLKHLTLEEIVKHGFNSRRKNKVEKFIEPIVDQFMRGVLASRTVF